MKRHVFDPLSFLFGLTFAVAGLVFLLGDVDVTDLGWAWVWPVPLIFTGTLILSLAIRRDRPVEEAPGESVNKAKQNPPD